MSVLDNHCRMAVINKLDMCPDLVRVTSFIANLGDTHSIVEYKYAGCKFSNYHLLHFTDKHVIVRNGANGGRESFNYGDPELFDRIYNWLEIE